MKERIKFVLEWEKRRDEGEGKLNFSELCRVFGIERQTGYKWVERYLEGGRDLRALEERSRRPRESPNQVDEDVAQAVVAARKARPRWGPRKLRAWLVERYPETDWPSASWMGETLRRHGLTRPPRKRGNKVVPLTRPFSSCDAPNDVWCIDFKGKFRLGNRQWCHVLTLTDACSRYLLRCEALLEPNGREVERICDSAFQEYGLPKALRSDNGPPFASTGAGGLTKLAVWWLRLGIRLERIAPGKPQQNGRHERFHLTLEEVVDPPAPNLRTQQRSLDLWRREYNEARPHEALGQRPPLTAYERSPRSYPRSLIRFDPPFDAHELRADRNGCIRWKGRKIFISQALNYEHIILESMDFVGARYEVRFGDLPLGTLDTSRLDRGLIRPRRRRSVQQEVSSMSLVQDEATS